jgi:hypothetical protein
MHLANYLGLLHRAEEALAGALAAVAEAHRDEPDVKVVCQRFAGQATAHAQALAPSSTATAATGPRSRSACTPSCSAAPAKAASACCATCTTCP